MLQHAPLANKLLSIGIPIETFGLKALTKTRRAIKHIQWPVERLWEARKKASEKILGKDHRKRSSEDGFERQLSLLIDKTTARISLEPR